MDAPLLRSCPNCGSYESTVSFREGPFRVVRCEQCGLTFLGNPPPEDELYEDYYDGSELDAADYRAESSDPAQCELFAINRQRVERIALAKPSGTLLDIGCGRGQFVWSAQQAGFESSGIDVSQRAVDYARDRLGVDAQVRDLEDVSRSGDTFDVITMWHVLEHFADPFATLCTVRDMLKPEGICVVEVPNLHSLKFVLSRTKWKGGNHPLYHRTFFTSATLRRAFRDAGFDDVQRERWSYQVPGRSRTFEQVKRGLDLLGLDAFLDVTGRR